MLAVSPTAQVELCRVVEGDLHGTFAAVKRLPHEMSEDPDLRDMFRDETWMATLVSHPNVARVLGWGEDKDGPFLASEFVRGVSLVRLMRTVFSTGEAFTERLIVFMAAKLCGGLAAAHDLKSRDGEHLELVHRDLTPGNILLGFDGSVKITDFGLAKAKMRVTQTAIGMTKGDPAYMSPEQVVGGKLDGRSDIFALGIVLFELFAQKKPWSVTNVEEALKMIVEGSTPNLRESCPRIDKKLISVIERCLHKDPNDRYENVRALKERLDEWLMLHGYQDSQDTLARFVRRNAMRQMRWVDRAMAGDLAKQDPSKAEPSPLELSRDEPIPNLEEVFSQTPPKPAPVPAAGRPSQASKPIELKEPAVGVEPPRPSMTHSATNVTEEKTMRTRAKVERGPPPTSKTPALQEPPHAAARLSDSRATGPHAQTAQTPAVRPPHTARPARRSDHESAVRLNRSSAPAPQAPAPQAPAPQAPAPQAPAPQPSVTHGAHTRTAITKSDRTPSQIVSRKRDAAPPLGATEDSRLALPPVVPSQATSVRPDASRHEDQLPTGRHVARTAPYIEPPKDAVYEPEDPTGRLVDEPSTLRKAPVLNELQQAAQRIALGASALADKALASAHQARVAAHNADAAARRAQASAMRAEQAAEAARLAAESVQLAQSGDLHRAIELSHRAQQLHTGAVEEG